jgi:hypothetical protein
MGEQGEKGQGAGRLGFLDSLGRLFRGKPEAALVRPEADRLEQLGADFSAALQSLQQKIDEGRRGSAPTELGPAAAPAETSEQREAARTRRREESHRAMREEIGKAHAELGTELAGEDLEALAAFVRELEQSTSAGRGSHTLLPRARYAIGEKLRVESGALAVARLVALLERAKRSWPDPTRHSPGATPEEIERSRRRRLAEVRETFLASDFERTSERMLGIVRGWGGDYPDPGSPLWQECVLEGVAAGIRGQLLREFVELLERDRDALLGAIEASVGKELAALQGVLAGGVRSLEEASEAVDGSLRVLDEMVPEMAWERVRAVSPQARGELGAARSG